VAVIIGVDAHKRSHTLVGVDERGRKLATKTVDATGVGHAEALRWAYKRFGADLVWGVEDVRSVSASLERELLAAGQRVVRVPPRLMGQTRASARVPGKSDPLDALAVARTVLQEPDLPLAKLDEASRELKLLVDHREDLLGQLLATTNRLLWRLHELDPAAAPERGGLRSVRNRQAVAGFLAHKPGLVAELARADRADVERLTALTEALEKRIAATVQELAPALLALPGCGPLTAAQDYGGDGDGSDSLVGRVGHPDSEFEAHAS
jgi:transposase